MHKSTVQEAAFITHVQAGLTELLELRLKHTESDVLSSYVGVLIPYLRSDRAELKRVFEELQSNVPGSAPERVLLQRLAKLRLEIRNRAVRDETIRLLQNTDLPAPFWAGEVAFVIAMAHETTENYVQARDWYLKSSKHFDQIGAARKSVKALQNHVACESRAFPQKKLIIDYDFVVRKAKAVGEFGIAGVALNNISQEYHQMGALECALKYCNQAIELLSEHDFGTLHYFLALVHRCHVLLELGREREAELDIQQASAATFVEIQGALEVLKLIRFGGGKGAIPEDTTFTWKQRASRLGKKASKDDEPLTATENTLVSMLAITPHDKFELIEKLYGKQLDFDAADNRLKVLLSRLRKKRPGLIFLIDGKYQVVDETVIGSSVL